MLMFMHKGSLEDANAHAWLPDCLCRGAYDPRDYRTWPSYSAVGNCVCSAPDATSNFASVPAAGSPCPQFFGLFNQLGASGSIQVPLRTIHASLFD